MIYQIATLTGARKSKERYPEGGRPETEGAVRPGTKRNLYIIVEERSFQRGDWRAISGLQPV